MPSLVQKLLLFSGGAPAISVSPSSWDFGSTPVGTPVSKEFTIENTGTAALEITLPITIVGAEASAFTVTAQPAVTELAPGASTTFTVQADADAVDTFNADISITNNSSENPKLVAIEVDVSATLFEDSFTGGSAVTGNADVRGYRTITDVEAIFSQAGGALVNTLPASAAWNEAAYLAQPSSGQAYFTRPIGYALVAVGVINHTTRGESMLGWWPTSALDSSPDAGVYTLSNNFRTRHDAANVSDSLAYSASTDYPPIAVWTSEGFSTFVKIGGIWQRQWVKYENVTQAYCGLSIFNSVGSCKSFKVVAVDESLFAPALSISAPSVGNLANMPDGDFLLYLDNITLPSAGNAILRVRKKDTSNYWREQIDNLGAFTIDEVVAGTPTNRISGSGVVSTDDIITIARGATMQAWRNTTALGSAYTSTYNFLREIGLELNSLGTGGAIGALYAWKARLLDETGLGAELVVDGTMTSSVANWPAIGAPTTREYLGGRLHLVTNATFQGAQQAIAGLTIGNYYQISVDYEVVSGANIVIDISTFAAQPLSGSGTRTFGFVATATSHTIRFYSSGGANEFYIDNVSMKAIQFTADSLATVLDGLSA